MNKIYVFVLILLRSFNECVNNHRMANIEWYVGVGLRAKESQLGFFYEKNSLSNAVDKFIIQNKLCLINTKVGLSLWYRAEYSF